MVGGSLEGILLSLVEGHSDSQSADSPGGSRWGVPLPNYFFILKPAAEDPFSRFGMSSPLTAFRSAYTLGSILVQIINHKKKKGALQIPVAQVPNGLKHSF